MLQYFRLVSFVGEILKGQFSGPLNICFLNTNYGRVYKIAVGASVPYVRKLQVDTVWLADLDRFFCT